jgi:hypothetical protein
MSYFELKDNDVFVNTIETYPDSRFYIHSGSIFLNNRQAISGTYSDNILGVPEGFVSLFEYNINRATSNRIYPFITKGGQKQRFKSQTDTQFNADFSYDGAMIASTYNLSASISRETITTTAAAGFKRLRALKTSLNHYSFWSRHFDFATYYATPNVNLLNVPSIFYGSSIKRGTVVLKSYIGGTLVATATDISRRGELVQSGSTDVIGTILYDEGILLLTGSTSLGSYGTTVVRDLRWIDFGYGIQSGETLTLDYLSASFSLDFQGVSQVQNMTVLAKAPEGMLNHSNNPTYLKSSENPFEQFHSSSYEFIEKRRVVKNVVPSNQVDIEPPFQKETYISKICIYDENRRLVGVCKLANPIRKTEAKEYLFKMKLDL